MPVSKSLFNVLVSRPSPDAEINFSNARLLECTKILACDERVDLHRHGLNLAWACARNRHDLVKVLVTFGDYEKFCCDEHEEMFGC